MKTKLTPYSKFTPLQRKWIRLLESGKYKQGKDSLKKKVSRTIKYCCLGVACEFVLGIKNEILEDGDFEFGYSGEVAVIPGIHWAKLKLRSAIGGLKTGDMGVGSLAGMNDSGWSFKKIARYIRTKPWNVFTNFKEPKE